MDFLQYDSITIFQKNPQPNPTVTGGEPSLLCTPTLNFKQLIKKTQNSFSSTQDHRDWCFLKGSSAEMLMRSPWILSLKWCRFSFFYVSNQQQQQKIHNNPSVDLLEEGWETPGRWLEQIVIHSPPAASSSVLSLSDCLLEHQHNDLHNYYLLKLKKKKIRKAWFFQPSYWKCPRKGLQIGSNKRFRDSQGNKSRFSVWTERLCVLRELFAGLRPTCITPA